VKTKPPEKFHGKRLQREIELLSSMCQACGFTDKVVRPARRIGCNWYCHHVHANTARVQASVLFGIPHFSEPETCMWHSMVELNATLYFVTFNDINKKLYYQDIWQCSALRLRGEVILCFNAGYIICLQCGSFVSLIPRFFPLPPYSDPFLEIYSPLSRPAIN
jgi:hypothetical protein